MPELIIIAGPSGSGKTTFIRSLLAGETQGWPDELEPVDLTGWTHVNARQVGKRKLDPADDIILHIDIARSFDGQRGGPLIEFMDRYSITSCITLWAPYSVLKRRSRKRFVEAVRRHLRRDGARKKTRRHLQTETRRHFKQTKRRYVVERYDNWFGFVDRLGPKSHWLVNSAKPKLSRPRPAASEKEQLYRALRRWF